MDDLIPPKPPPPRPKLFSFWKLFFVSVGVSAGVEIGSRLLNDAPDLGETAEFSAFDRTWLATQIELRPFLGSWELSTVLTVIRERQNALQISELEVVEVLGGLCGAILSTMPLAPDETIRRDDVFRLSLNFWHIQEGELADTTQWPMPVPLAIVDRACPQDISLESNPLSYPFPLDRWRLVGFDVKPNSVPGMDGLALFRATDDANTPLSADLACLAMLHDAPVFRENGAFENGDEIAVLTELPDTGFSQSTRFRVINGECVPFEEERTL